MPNVLKTAYLQRPIGQVDNFRDQITKSCHWSPSQWFNKLHGRTVISPLEEIEIKKVIKRFVDAERIDIVEN